MESGSTPLVCCRSKTLANDNSDKPPSTPAAASRAAVTAGDKGALAAWLGAPAKGDVAAAAPAAARTAAAAGASPSAAAADARTEVIPAAVALPLAAAADGAAYVEGSGGTLRMADA